FEKIFEEKHKAVDLACRTSNSHAAQHYSLDLTMLGRWVKTFSQGPFPQNNLRSIGSGRRALFPEEEAQLYEWLISAKQTNDVTKKLAINNFKLSPRWLNRFLKRHDLSLR
ncbi:13546_t:CDS:2, partial [Cetraspora pellucida]